jgi:hypothetical protein
VVRGLLRVVAALLVFGLAAWAFVFFVTPLSEGRVARLLADEAGSPYFDERCVSRGDEGWRCDVADRGGSGSATYLVTRHGRRCLTARRVSPNSATETPMPLTLRRCLHPLDLLPGPWGI